MGWADGYHYQPFGNVIQSWMWELGCFPSFPLLSLLKSRRFAQARNGTNVKERVFSGPNFAIGKERV